MWSHGDGHREPSGCSHGDVTIALQRPGGGLLALSVATALAIPLGMGTPSTAAATHEVLLGTTGSLAALPQAVSDAAVASSSGSASPVLSWLSCPRQSVPRRGRMSSQTSP